MLHNENANGNTALTLADIQAACTSLHEEFQSKLSALQTSIDSFTQQQPIQLCGMQFESERHALENIMAWAKVEIMKKVKEYVMDMPDSIHIDADCITDYISIEEDEIEFTVNGREIEVSDTRNCINVDDAWVDELDNDITRACNDTYLLIENATKVDVLVDSFLTA